jgi:hypothetical protein
LVIVDSLNANGPVSTKPGQLQNEAWQAERKRTELRGEADQLAARGAFSGALCLTSKADKNPWRFTCGRLQGCPKDLDHWE